MSAQATHPRDIGAPYMASGDAMPPILPHEAVAAQPAICRYHGGMIADQRASADRDGMVFLCPVGKSYWRLTSKPRSSMYSPLRFPKGL